MYRVVRASELKNSDSQKEEKELGITYFNKKKNEMKRRGQNNIK